MQMATNAVINTITIAITIAHMTAIQPKKLLLSKWTAVEVVARQKHFLVTRLIYPEGLEDKQMVPESVEIEAVYSKVRQEISWRELQDESRWIRGWK